MQATAGLGRGLLACLGLVILVDAAPVRAQSSALQVGATVAPRCLITVDGQSGDRSPAVTVSCGSATLRALRVTTTRGETIVPVPAATVRRVRAGGDLVFVVAQPVARVTSLAPLAGLNAARLPGSVTVTLDF